MSAQGNLLKIYRVGAGVSQTELANHLGWESGQYVSNIERGLCPVPHKSLKKICKKIKLPQSAIKDAIILDFIKDLNKHL